MDRNRLRSLFSDVRAGRVEPDDALDQLRSLPFVDLGFAKVDHHRPLRVGCVETIYGEGKSSEQIVAIARELVQGGTAPVMVTRISEEAARALAALDIPCHYSPLARMCVLNWTTDESGNGRIGCVAVAAAGTSDLPVAEEAALTLEVLNSRVDRIYDVGVAGLHRLLEQWPMLRKARVGVVVAGMEGALPSVLGGLVECPLIAVPTSVGYGANFGGLAALLAMLNSCAPGISVVNVDNGFGAAVQADKINKLGGP